MPMRTGAPLPPLMPRNTEAGQAAEETIATNASEVSLVSTGGGVLPEHKPNTAASESSGSEESVAKMTGSGASEIVVIVNGQAKVLKGKSSYLLVDVLDVVAFNLADAKGRQPIVKVNGVSTTFMQAIKDSDVIELGWKS